MTSHEVDYRRIGHHAPNVRCGGAFRARNEVFCDVIGPNITQCRQAIGHEHHIRVELGTTALTLFIDGTKTNSAAVPPGIVSVTKLLRSQRFADAFSLLISGEAAPRAIPQQYALLDATDVAARRNAAQELVKLCSAA